MTKTSVSHTLEALDTIIKACEEIQAVLHEQVEKTTNPSYLADFQRDIVTLDNLKLIIVTVSEDFRSERVGASTELLLRIAANDFKQKLAIIPEKKTLRKEIELLLKDVHKDVVKFKVHLSGSGLEQ
jgi:Asp-tRNA(Asn)/Glu-tRNA(Gln) amidotransferase C subunit